MRTWYCRSPPPQEVTSSTPGRRAQHQPHQPVLGRAQVHVAHLFATDSRGALDGVPEHLSQTRGVGSHARLAVAFGQTITDFLQPLVGELAREVDVHVVFEIHGDERQPEQADRADLLHLGQAGHRRLDREGEQLLDVLGGETRRFGVDADLHRRHVRKGVDRHRADGLQAEERDHGKDDQHQHFVAQRNFDEMIQHDVAPVLRTLQLSGHDLLRAVT